ncbi:CLUMA_CG001262, isoform A [Clunio marinus]|uniref:CLUMA_CG001262, isoform A n=1 Tax=Clunio marinus TaxID=568069 RepID=A0A1J1HHI3_9DIPT|nr:CLUMA_CG001262, isoform A [Clunio marinus]
MTNGIVRAIKRNLISQLFIASTILTSGAIINVIQVLLHILVKPVNKRLFHRLMYYVSWTWLAQCVFIADFWSNTELIIYCKKEVFDVLGKEHHFTLMNHCYEIDWLIGWLVLEKFGCLGNARGFIKNVIKYIPICGWFFGFAEHIFLQRSFEKDKAVIEERLDDILQYPDNSWTVVTAEGTRFTKEKHEASQKFASERNMVPLKHHLIPRGKGFITCVPILKKYKNLSVLNLQLAFDKSAKVEPTLVNLLRGEKVVAHVYIERISIDNVEPTQDYLNKMYQEKDEIQDSFLKFGNFFEGLKQKPIDGIRMKPRLCVAVNTLLWFALNLSFMLYYATKMILAGRFVFLLSISGGVIALFYIMMQNIIRHSKVNKGSQYGKK